MLDSEINGVKTELHYHAPDRQCDKKGIMRRLREAIDPGAAEVVYAEKDRVFVKSLREIADDLVSMGVPAQYAVYQAYEIKRGAERLTNVAATMNHAEDLLEEDRKYSLPSEGFNSYWLPAAEKATETYMREMLGKILAGEMEYEGSFSNRTVSIVETMSKEDVETFELFCSLCAGGVDSMGIEQPTIPCIFLDGSETTYCGGAIEHSSIASLVANGLVQAKSKTVFKESEGVILCINGVSYKLDGQLNGRICIGDTTFTVYGKELSRLCRIGVHPKLMDVVSSYLSKKGYSLVESTPYLVGSPAPAGGESIIEVITSSDIDKMFE